jgi:hypothetical protein
MTSGIATISVIIAGVMLFVIVGSVFSNEETIVTGNLIDMYINQDIGSNSITLAFANVTQDTSGVVTLDFVHDRFYSGKFAEENEMESVYYEYRDLIGERVELIYSDGFISGNGLISIEEA